MAAGSIARNLEEVRRRIAAAARRAGRDPESVTLVGVSKTFPAEAIGAAFEAGLRDFGENRVQEAREKVPLAPAGIRWHLVGHLQSNKAALAARLFQVIHSIDSADRLERLERAAAGEGRRLAALVQVDLAGEPTKFGARADEVERILEAARGTRSVALEGLMILPPHDPDTETARPYFRRLREMLEAARRRHPGLALRHLSMGMTEDFEVGIEEGATIVRIGRAIFGERTRTE